MLEFPKIKKPSMPFKTTIADTSIKGQLENQTIIARKRYTRTLKQFELHWNALPETDYIKLRDFYIEVNTGVPFFWIYPIKRNSLQGKKYKVRFDSDFEFSYFEHNLWQGTIKLVEVI